MSSGGGRPGRFRVIAVAAVVVAVSALVTAPLLLRPQPGGEQDGPEITRPPSGDTPGSTPADARPGGAARLDGRAEDPATDSDPLVSDPVTLNPVTEETAQRGLQFLANLRSVSPQLTLDRFFVLDALQDPTAPEAPMLAALLAGTDGSAQGPTLESFIIPGAREYLPDELHSALAERGEVLITYLVSNDDGREDLLQFVLFHREAATIVLLYLQDRLIVDGEIIPREWSPRETLATGGDVGTLHFP